MLRNRTEALLERSRYEEAIAVADRVLQHRERPGWGYLAAKAIACRGRGHRAMGSYDEAAEDLELAVGLFRELGEQHAAAHALHGLGLVDKIQGRLELAEERVAEALEILIRHGAAENPIGSAWMSRGSIALVAGQLDLAERCVTEALRIGRELGMDILTASALAGLAEIDRELGRLDQAETRYEEAWRMLREAGLGRALVVRLNLGIVYGLRGDHGRSRSTLLEIQRAVRRQGRKGLDGVCAGLVLPACVGLGRLDEAAEQLALAREILDVLGVAEPDVARAAEMAAAACSGELSQGCLELAESQWGRARREDDRARVAAALALVR
ncbi:MAG TPA: tetratricopeptide repeat protein [Myxococcota bacterium]|nr:tetratricopeptide repeat protein [Myxococcota bacterium]